VWAGWDNAWEQKKLEATLREMLVKRGDSQLSAARFVRRFFVLPTDLAIISKRDI